MYGASQQPFGSRGGSANANTVTRVTVGRMECHFIVDPTDTMWFSHAEVRWPLGRLEPLSVFAIGGGARLRAARCEPPQPLFFKPTDQPRPTTNHIPSPTGRVGFGALWGRVGGRAPTAQHPPGVAVGLVRTVAPPRQPRQRVKVKPAHPRRRREAQRLDGPRSRRSGRGNQWGYFAHVLCLLNPAPPTCDRVIPSLPVSRFSSSFSPASINCSGQGWRGAEAAGAAGGGAWRACRRKLPAL